MNIMVRKKNTLKGLLYLKPIRTMVTFLAFAFSLKKSCTVLIAKADGNPLFQDLNETEHQ